MVGQQEGAGDGRVRGYIVSHEAWYSGHRALKDNNPEIMVHGGRDGETDWEFGIRLHRISAIRVEVFADAFAAFADEPALFAALAEERPDTLEQVVEILDRLGFTDHTLRTNPRTGDVSAQRPVTEEYRLRELVAQATAQGPLSGEERARIRAAAGIEDQS